MHAATVCTSEFIPNIVRRHGKLGLFADCGKGFFRLISLEVLRDQCNLEAVVVMYHCHGVSLVVVFVLCRKARHLPEPN